MSEEQQFIQGEFTRTLGDRFRVTLPTELDKVFKPKNGNCAIVKERPGCLSLWEAEVWASHLDTRIELIQLRLRTGDIKQRTPELQRFGRLLSTRHRLIRLEGKGRLVLPDGFREFLAVKPEGEVVFVGAYHCIEIWHPEKWINYQENDIPEFDNLVNLLSH